MIQQQIKEYGFTVVGRRLRQGNYTIMEHHSINHHEMPSCPMTKLITAITALYKEGRGGEALNIRDIFIYKAVVQAVENLGIILLDKITISFFRQNIKLLYPLLKVVAIRY